MIKYILVGVCAIHLLTAVSGALPYKRCPKLWKAKGCRIDDDQGLTTLFDDRKNSKRQINWDDLEGYIWDLACRCREAALKMRFSWFALENYGICFSAAGPIEQFLKKYKLAPDNNCIGKLKFNKTIVSAIDGELCVGGQMRAYFYKIETSNGEGQETIGGGEEEVAPKKSCSKVSDVVFAIDVSGSVGAANFKLFKNFMQEFVERYDFSKGKSRLAILTFDHAVYQQLSWKDSAIIGVQKIRQIINKMKYTGGGTMTQKALKHAIKYIIRPFKRKGVPIAFFVVSDGGSWKGEKQLETPSKMLRKIYGCKMITIGIGKEINRKELKIITNDNRNIFLFSSFVNLIEHAAKYLNSLVGRACA